MTDDYVIRDPEYYDVIEEEFVDENEICEDQIKEVKQKIINALETSELDGLGQFLAYVKVDNDLPSLGTQQRKESLGKSSDAQFMQFVACDICYRYYPDSDNLERHRKLHTSVKSVDKLITICGGNEKDQQEKLHKCEICDKTFLNKKTLKEPLAIKHNGKLTNPYEKVECDICGRSFSKKCIKRHKRSHDGNIEGVSKRFNCGICGKEMNHKKGMEAHIRIHTGEKPFKCKVCGMAFVQSGHLRRHNRVHTGEPAYHKGALIECEVCGRSFGELKTLTSHMKTHFPPSECEFKCDFCPKEYHEKHHLVRHMRLHTGEKPYKCEFCDRRFRCHDVYRNHRRVHTKERPYSCNVCNSSFTQLSTLRMHMHVHSGEPRYTCRKCGEKFGKHKRLKQHRAEFDH